MRCSLLGGSVESRRAASVGNKVLATWRLVQLDFGGVMGSKGEHSHVPCELIFN